MRRLGVANPQFLMADQLTLFFDITSRAMSDKLLRFSTTASCGLIVIPNWFSRNVTTLSTAMESRIPVVINGVVSVNAAGSSPGRYSLRMNVFTVGLISCGFIIKDSRLGVRPVARPIGYGFSRCDTCCVLCEAKSSGTTPSYNISASSRCPSAVV